MIGGIIMIIAALWVYQSAMRAKVNNVLMWVAISAAVFFAVQMLLVQFNIYILEAIKGSESNAGYERDLLSIGDRKNESGFQGVGGILLSIFFELMPPIAGFMAVAVVRNKFVLKEEFNLANLFSGLKELFQGIKQSFKTTEK
ncbi:MAG: hypothetical protein M8364_05770 [Methylobacter sp.]|jgi:hypothetical protein|uniref:hypothetical protein n=1 Tax=Methylobacter sp. TaxID=2051955 RepID=UPI002589B37C|nr:hypothetical protein [Methylobacter sp.]MCL7420393.1 hypothetical protein [Methylobacter sp.]